MLEGAKSNYVKHLNQSFNVDMRSLKNGRKNTAIWREKEKLYEEMRKEINKLEEEITDLKQVNRELADYVEALEEKESLKCKGRKISDVGGKTEGKETSPYYK